MFALLYLGERLVLLWLRKRDFKNLISWKLLINAVAYSGLSLILLGILHLVFKKINPINLLWLDIFIYIFIHLISLF